MLTLVDRGGTFTDVVRIAPNETVCIEKIPSDRAVIGELTDGPLRFGATVTTDALLPGDRGRIETPGGGGYSGESP